MRFRVTPRQKKLINQSIQHWTRLATGKRRKDENIFTSDCPLCRVYYNRSLQSCKGCPIAKKTGLTGCNGTPWRGANMAAVHCGLDTSTFKAAANEMLQFLKDLLPKKRK